MDNSVTDSADVFKDLNLKFELKGLNDRNIMVNDQVFSDRGLVIDKTTKKIKAAIEGVITETPWVYTRSHPEVNCGLWHNIMFDIYGILPKGCLTCYKVVVKPRTVEELFKLYTYQKEISDKYCKCGIEVRTYVFGNYGGYFYTRSLEEGRERYREVRADIGKYISSDIPVYLKKGCTEFEQRFGDSKGWDDIRNDAMEVKEQEILKNTDIVNECVEAPEMVLNAQFLKWLSHAYSVGDTTVLQYNAGRPFYASPRTYHIKDKKKMDKIINKNNGNGGHKDD